MEIRILAEFKHDGEYYKNEIIIDSKQINDVAMASIFETISEQAASLPYVPDEYNSFKMLRHICLLLKSVKKNIRTITNS